MSNMSIKPENQNKPATKSQLYTLYLLSKKLNNPHDFREDNLTMSDASLLIKKFNEKTGYVRDMIETKFMEYVKQHIIPNVYETLSKALGYKSTVIVEGGNEKPRRYGFCGFGCGFAIIDYDKRSHVGKRIEDIANKHIREIYDNVMNMFDETFKAKLEAEGTPIGAVCSQDIQVQSTFWNGVADFMKNNGVKKVQVRTWLD